MIQFLRLLNFCYPLHSSSRSVRTSRNFTAKLHFTLGKCCEVAKVQIPSVRLPLALLGLSFSMLRSSVADVVTTRSPCGWCPVGMVLGCGLPWNGSPGWQARPKRISFCWNWFLRRCFLSSERGVVPLSLPLRIRERRCDRFDMCLSDRWRCYDLRSCIVLDIEIIVQLCVWLNSSCRSLM